MPSLNAEIIVLKKTKLAEMDLIITGFASSGQQLRAVVRGGRKPGSRRGAHLELFCRSNVLLHEGRSLHTVAEAELIEAHQGCRQDIEHSAAAAAITELVEVISRDADSEPRLFPLLEAALSTLDHTPASGLALIIAATLLKIMAQSGFRPNLENCLSCGQALPTRPDLQPSLAQQTSQSVSTSSWYFSAVEGGLICPSCAAGTPLPELTVCSPHLLDWITLAIQSRFVDLADYTSAEYQTIGRQLLNFAQSWQNAQVTSRNRSLDFYLSFS